MLPDYCIPTKEWMDQLENKGYRVIDIQTPIFTDTFYEGFKNNWGFDDILICGQEHISTIEMIEEMKDCEHLFCASPCKIYESTLGHKGEMINMIDFIKGEPKLYDFEYLENKKFVNGICGMEFCYIKKELQLKIDINKNEFHQQNIESIISKISLPYLKKGFHLHGLHHNNKDF